MRSSAILLLVALTGCAHLGNTVASTTYGAELMACTKEHDTEEAALACMCKVTKKWGRSCEAVKP